MTLQPFIDADPNNPPKCKICNDYGGLFDDEKIDPHTGEPWSTVCEYCSDDNYRVDTLNPTTGVVK